MNTDESPASEFSFEAAMDEVQSINRQLQDGSIGVDDMLQAAERGRHLIGQCESKLRRVSDELQRSTPSGTELDQSA